MELWIILSRIGLRLRASYATQIKRSSAIRYCMLYADKLYGENVHVLHWKRTVLCVDTVDRQDRIDATRTYCTLGLDVSVPGYCLGDEVVPYGPILYIIQIAIMLVQM